MSAMASLSRATRRSAKPRNASILAPRPRLLRLSAKATGKLPRPAKMATGPSPAAPATSHLVAIAGNAQRPVTAGANEIEDLVHDRMILELGRHVLDALLQGAFIGEEQPVSAAQCMNVVAGEAAPFE